VVSKEISTSLKKKKRVGKKDRRVSDLAFPIITTGGRVARVTYAPPTKA